MTDTELCSVVTVCPWKRGYLCVVGMTSTSMTQNLKMLQSTHSLYPHSLAWMKINSALQIGEKKKLSTSSQQPHRSPQRQPNFLHQTWNVQLQDPEAPPHHSTCLPFYILRRCLTFHRETIHQVVLSLSLRQTTRNNSLTLQPTFLTNESKSITHISWGAHPLTRLPEKLLTI